MRKPKLFLAFLLLLILSLLAACGGANGDGGGNALPSGSASGGESAAGGAAPAGELGGRLTVLTHRTDYASDGTFDAYVEKFKEKYPKAEIEFEALTNYAVDIKVRLTTGEVGDVLMIDPGIKKAELSNYFEPLPDSLFDNVYFPDVMAYEGKRYGISTGVNTQGIVYNKEAFLKAGVDKVPTTLDELYAAAEKLKAADIVPLYMNYGAQWPMGNWAENSAWYVSGDPAFHNTMITMDAPFQTDNAWGILAGIARTFVENGWVEKDLSTNNWELSKGEVASGKAAMYFLGNWVIPQVIGAGTESGNVGFFPLPYDNSGQYNVPLGSDYTIGVSKNSGNKELAIKWVEFFVKESGYQDQSGFMPIDKSQQPQVEQLAEFKSFNPVFIEQVPDDPRFSEIANKAEIPFFTGGFAQEVVVAKDLQQAFDDYNKKWADARKALGY